MRALCACKHMVQQVGGGIKVRVSHCVPCCSRRICVRSHEHHAFPFMQQQWKFWGQQLEAATLWRTSHTNTLVYMTYLNYHNYELSSFKHYSHCCQSHNVQRALASSSLTMSHLGNKNVVIETNYSESEGVNSSE